MTRSCHTFGISSIKSTIKTEGLSVYGEVTLIKSVLVPKIVYTSTLLPSPEHIVKVKSLITYIRLYGKVKIKYREHQH